MPQAAAAMTRALFVAGLAVAAFGLALIFEVDAATSLWIWPAAPAPNHAFVGSVALAAAALLLWIARTGWLGALQPLAWNALIATTGTALTLFRAPGFDGDARVRVYAWLAALLAASAATGLLALRARAAPADAPPAPPVRRSFAAFALLFAGVGACEVLGLAEAFPWPLSSTAAGVYGSIALGAAAYFAHLSLRPSARAARSALLGFLAYDLGVLLPLARFAPSVAPGRVPSLILYGIVLLWSGALALWTLRSPARADGAGARAGRAGGPGDSRRGFR